MEVLFKFLGDEPVDNVITCMNFKLDKVVYFGYHEVIGEQKKRIENFLINKCSVKKAVFHPLSHDDLQSVLSSMRNEIEYELEQGNHVFFDITGGESMLLVAFGMLAQEYVLPIHMYDIETGKLIELDEGSDVCMSSEAERQRVFLNLDAFIRLHGGKINHALHKDIKESVSKDFGQDIEKIWKAARSFGDLWNPLSVFMSSFFIPDDDLSVRQDASYILNALKNSDTRLDTASELNKMLDTLAKNGILLDLKHEDGKYSFRYKNEDVKTCLFEGGSVLELYVYQQQRKNGGDCRVGVHLDWDGKIHDNPGEDVLNEIDVLSLNGYVPTFISCKSGKMGPQQSLHALYELDTVARRFGGKYAKKVLVTADKLGDIYLERAREMGIEIYTG